MNTNEQPTPDTDAAINDTALENKNHPHTDWVTATFARKLERRLNEACEALEREQMRLAACDVVAMADTETSREPARDIHKDYWSAAVESVIRRVDECIELRKKLEAMREAIKDADAALRAWPKAGSGMSTDHTLQSQAFRTGQAALAKLKPFITTP